MANETILSLTNETQAFILSVVDSNIDFNIKLILFGFIIAYGILFYYINKSLVIDSFAKMVYSLFSKIYIFATLLFLPLFTIMLFREYEAISLWTLILQAYGSVFVLLALVLLFMGWQKCLNIVGIDFDMELFKSEKGRKGEFK